MNRLMAIVAAGVVILSPSHATAEKLFPDGQVKMLYVANCAECHGRKGRGSEEGPSLHDNEYVKESSAGEVARLVADGIPKNKKRYSQTDFASLMDGYGESLSTEEIQRLAELVKSWSKR